MKVADDVGRPRRLPGSRERGAYGYLVWGTCFLLIGLHVDGGPDLLADPVGSAIVWVGAGRLASRTPAFSYAAWSAVVFGIVGWLLPAERGASALLLNELLEFGYLWFLTSAVAVDTAARGWFEDARRARTIRSLSAVLLVLAALSVWTGSALPGALWVLGWIVEFALLICLAASARKRAGSRREDFEPSGLSAHGEPT